MADGKSNGGILAFASMLTNLEYDTRANCLQDPELCVV